MKGLASSKLIASLKRPDSGESMKIAIAACGCEGPVTLARSLASKAAELGVKILLGGCWGLMGKVVDEAARAGVEVYIFLPLGYQCPAENREHVTVIHTNMTENFRSALLTSAADALLALGGGAGTLMEVLMAYRERKRIALVKGHGMDTDKYFELMEKGIDSRELAEVKAFEDPGEALEWLVKG